MEDRTHDDKGAKVRAIVDDAIAELLLLGFANRDEAAFAMAVQATVRIEGNGKLKEFEKFVADWMWDVDDPGAPES